MLLDQSRCRSVLVPMNEIWFDDAAVFWAAFYHLMFKAQRDTMSDARIKETVGICAALVNERFRLFSPGGKEGRAKNVTIGPPKEAKPTVE